MLGKTTMKSFVPVRYLKAMRFGLVMIGLLGAWGYRVPLWNAVSMIGDPKAIVDYLQQFESFGLVMLSLLMLAQVFLALIPGQALMIASGYLYGAPMTIVVVATTSIIGSQLAFWLARRCGRPLIDKIASPKIIGYWNRLAGNCGPGFFFITFLLPFFPSDMMCYVAGLGKVSPKGFFVANFAGRLLGAIAFTLFGAYGFRPPLWFWIAVVVGLTVILSSWLIYKKKNLQGAI